MADVVLHAVFEYLALSASVSLPRTEFAEYELLGSQWFKKCSINIPNNAF